MHFNWNLELSDGNGSTPKDPISKPPNLLLPKRKKKTGASAPTPPPHITSSHGSWFTVHGLPSSSSPSAFACVFRFPESVYSFPISHQIHPKRGNVLREGHTRSETVTHFPGSPPSLSLSATFQHEKPACESKLPGCTVCGLRSARRKLTHSRAR